MEPLTAAAAAIELGDEEDESLATTTTTTTSAAGMKAVPTNSEPDTTRGGSGSNGSSRHISPRALRPRQEYKNYEDWEQDLRVIRVEVSRISGSGKPPKRSVVELFSEGKVLLFYSASHIKKARHTKTSPRSSRRINLQLEYFPNLFDPMPPEMYDSKKWNCKAYGPQEHAISISYFKEPVEIGKIGTKVHVLLLFDTLEDKNKLTKPLNSLMLKVLKER